MLRSSAVAAGLLTMLLLILPYRANAQDSAEAHFDHPSLKTTIISRYSSGVVSVQGANVAITAKVSDLDLERSQVEDNFGDIAFYTLRLLCKLAQSGSAAPAGYATYNPGGAACVSGDMGDGTSFEVNCMTRSECENFLSVLKRAQRPPAPVPSQRIQQQQIQTQPRLAQPQVPTSTQAQPSQGKQAPPDSGFHDALDKMPGRNGSDTKALDDLAKKTKPVPKSPRPTAEQPTYAAFAQSAGFDANGEYGYAVDRNLNSAIGQANLNCVANAKTSCGDEGYCMLRLGLWGAWASDLKYLGAKASACNLKTQEEAENQALAWCGNECSVVWSGAGQ